MFMYVYSHKKSLYFLEKAYTLTTQPLSSF